MICDPCSGLANRAEFRVGSRPLECKDRLESCPDLRGYDDGWVEVNFTVWAKPTSPLETGHSVSFAPIVYGVFGFGVLKGAFMNQAQSQFCAHLNTVE